MSWPKDGQWYEIATSDPEEGKYTHPHRVLAHGIRFIDLRSYPLSRKSDKEVFQAHHSYFVGQAVEAGHPVTFVWEANYNSNGYDPIESLKVFDGDASQVGTKRLVVEHARATWIPKKQWPTGASATTRLARDWQEKFGKNGYGGFQPGPWRII